MRPASASRKNCLKPSGSLEPDLPNQVLVVVLALTALIGTAALWTRRVERHRGDRRQRLQALIPAPTSAASGPGLMLVRALPRRGVRDLMLLARLRMALDAALGATGDRIGYAHLAVVQVIAAAVVITFASQVLGLAIGIVIICGVAAALSAALLLIHLFQISYRNRFLNVFPDTLDLLDRAVRAGLPIIDAMEMAAREIPDPAGTEFRRVLDEMSIGISIEEALQRTADRIRVPDFSFYVVALNLQRRTGGALAETLGNLSRVIRRRKEVRLKARSLSAEAKASAVVLAILPFFVGGMMYMLNRPLMSVLFTDPRGRFMVGIALLSLLAGVSVMTWIIRTSLR
jgi:tight adherence protein B